MREIALLLHWLLTRGGVVFVVVVGLVWYVSDYAGDDLLGVIGGIWAICQVSAGLLKWGFNL